MARFTLRQLELFLELTEHTTLSAAASAAHISESGLSQAISELERVVGEQLCVRRRSRGFQLTPAGQLLAEHARTFVASADELVSRVAGVNGTLMGRVALGCYAGFSTTLLPPVLDGFAAAHPLVEIVLTVGSDDELIPLLMNGRLDTAIVYDMYLPDDLNRWPIYETEVFAVLPEGHRLASQSTVNLADLKDEPFILLDTAPSAANTRRVFAEQGFEPAVRIAVPNLELVRVLVGRSLGYSLLMWRPGFSGVTSEGSSVVMRPLEPQAGLSSVVGVWPRQMTLSRRASAMLAHLEADLSGGNHKPSD